MDDVFFVQSSNKVDRKVLAELAVNEPEVFKSIVDKARAAIT